MISAHALAHGEPARRRSGRARHALARPAARLGRAAAAGHARARSDLRDHLDGRAGADAVHDRPRDPGRDRRGRPLGARDVGAGPPGSGPRPGLPQGCLRHRFAVQNWLRASFLCVQVVAHHAARTGPAVRGRLSTGEVVATVTNDAIRIGGAFDITARLAGAIVSYVVVAAILLSTSVSLGLIVLVGVPVLAVTLGAVIRRSRRVSANSERRSESSPRSAPTRRQDCACSGGSAASRPSSTVTADARSRVRAAGVRDRDPAVDARRRPGAPAWDLRRGRHVDLGAVRPLGHDRRRRPGRVLRLRRVPRDPAPHRRGGRRQGDALPRRRPADARRARGRAGRERAGRAGAGASGGRPARRPAIGRRGPVRAHDVHRLRRPGGVGRDRGAARPALGRPRRPARRQAARGALARRRAAADRRQRAGADPLLRGASRPARPVAAGTVGPGDPRRRRGRERVRRARRAAGRPRRDDRRARPVVLGGQRQRLVLARALLADPEILVLVEPTSAVDAHTEARIARDLRRARVGRTTVIVTTSPLVLDQADRVVLVVDGRQVAEGTHRELLRERADYRETVTRGESE